MLHWSVKFSNKVESVTLVSRVLQHGGECCSGLQSVTTRWRVLQPTPEWLHILKPQFAQLPGWFQFAAGCVLVLVGDAVDNVILDCVPSG